LNFLYFGVLFFILGVLAYTAVGKLPNIYGFDSRHQLLVPLGFSFIVYFTTIIVLEKISKSEYIQNVILFTIIIAFISQNIYSGYRYKLDWIYQVAIQEQIKELSTIKDNTTFIVNIDLDNKLANERKINFYEHNQRLKKIFGNDSRLMIIV